MTLNWISYLNMTQCYIRFFFFFRVWYEIIIFVLKVLKIKWEIQITYRFTYSSENRNIYSQYELKDKETRQALLIRIWIRGSGSKSVDPDLNPWIRIWIRGSGSKSVDPDLGETIKRSEIPGIYHVYFDNTLNPNLLPKDRKLWKVFF